jgi:GT2 family glycosyltransferase
MLSVSIVAYRHNAEELEELIHSVNRVECVSKLHIIDNSPTDELRGGVGFGKVEYVFNPSNPGYGTAHNLAIRKSIDTGERYHLVLNPDVHFEPGTLEKLVDFMDRNADIANVMPQVYYPDGSIQYLCKLLPTPHDWIGRRFNPSKRMVEARNELFELRFTGYGETMDVPFLSGCFMFLRVEALEKVGLFDERIFMYSEETDLCRRLIRGGYRTVFYPGASIIHAYEGGSRGSLRLTWIAMKSAVYYFNKWGWFCDKERDRINDATLRNLGYEVPGRQ